MNSWRAGALLVGVIVTICGVALWHGGGGPMVFVLGTLMIITAALEPVYGRSGAAPRGASWRPSNERFVDPETGKLVTVWFDPRTGARRYVDDASRSRPAV